MVDNVLTDAESETGSLYVVVQLDEALKDAVLLLLGYTGTGVLAVDVEPVLVVALFTTVAHLDMSFVGVFDGVRDEVCDNLLHASLVECRRIGGVGVVLLELDASFLHTLCNGLADVVEDLCEVDVAGFDG